MEEVLEVVFYIFAFLISAFNKLSPVYKVLVSIVVLSAIGFGIYALINFVQNLPES